MGTLQGLSCRRVCILALLSWSVPFQLLPDFSRRGEKSYAVDKSLPELR